MSSLQENIFNVSDIYNKILEMYNSKGCGIHIYFNPNIFYIHTSKTGGTSIHNMLKQNFRKKEQPNNEKTFKYVANNWSTFFSFIFVRNTFDKIISEYNHEFGAIHKFDFDNWLSKVINKNKIVNRKNNNLFADYSNEYNEINQLSFILLNEEIYLKHIGIFENFNEEINKLREILKISAPIKHVNVSKKKKIKLNERQVELIKINFNEDINYFKYEYLY